MLGTFLPHQPDRVILGAVILLLVAALALGLAAPGVFWLAFVCSIALGVGFVALCHPVAFSVAGLLVAGLSLEMSLYDLIGTEMYFYTITAVKGCEIALAGVCAVRFGVRVDLVNPAWAYAAMFAAGMVHGLYPGLTAGESLRSMIGSVAPFAFCFCRLPQAWGKAIIRATKWCPVAAVGAGIPLAILGIRPLFIDSGGARLAGLGHPAFLAGICLPAIYACLIQLYREGRSGDLGLLATNGLILVLTGARAPLAYAVAVTGLSLLTIRGGAFAPRHRLLLVLGAAALLPAIVLLIGDLADIRLFNVIANEADNLSGRSLLWPMFEDASGQSPWVGWGIGAGNAVIPSDGRIAQLLHTWAAHNEYLRIQVEGGQLGRALLITLFAAWVLVHTRDLRLSDRRIMRLAFLAFACHAVTDNVLISTPACVLFAFAAAVFTLVPPPAERIVGRRRSASMRLALPGSTPLA